MQHGQAAVARVGVLDGADAALGGVGVEGLPALGCENGLASVRTPPGAAWNSSTASSDGSPPRMSHSSQPRRPARRVHGVRRPRQQAAAAQLAEDRRDAAGAVHVLHVVVAVGATLHRFGTRREISSMSAMREVDLGLVGGGEQVQHRVRRAAHRDVERHRVVERGARRDRARQHASRRPRRSSAARGRRRCGRPRSNSSLAGGVRGQRRAVARQREAERLGQAVHRVRGEHAGAGAAGRAGGAAR